MNAHVHPILRRVFYSAVAVALLVIAATGTAAYLFLKPYYLRAQAYDLRKLEAFNITSVFHDQQGAEIGRLFIEDRILLKHQDIPDAMRQATLAVEDRRFYSHGGIDFKGVARAFYINIRTFKCGQGGSTITQQVAKHLIGRFERTFDRKLEEAFLAARIEHYYSKDEILDFYLNRIYFGRGYFGLGAAAKGYFGKKAKDLTLSECATLASIIKAPNLFSPRNNLEAAIKRRNLALSLMADQQVLSREQADAAAQDSMQLVPEVPARGQSYFMAYAVRELKRVLDLGENGDIPQGLTVQTTLDLGMQRAAESEVRKKFDELTASGTTPSEDSDLRDLQVAATVLDISTGAVRVLVGGRDFEKSPFDRARMARRDNGSLLQPFIYSLAFERLKLTPASLVDASYLDESMVQNESAVTLGDPSRDVGKRFLMVQDALALANASSASRVKFALGTANFNKWLGTTGAARAVADGPNPLTLFELTSLYQMLGNSGVQREPYAIQKVVNYSGQVIYQAKQEAIKPVVDPLVAQQMTLTLQAVTRDGTASLLTDNYNFPSPVVGMSGYSPGGRDGWFIGYTPNHVAGVWIGFDKSLPIEPKSVATRTPVELWGNLMQKVMAKASTENGNTFPVPQGLSKVEVERRSGHVQGLGFMTPGAGNVFVYLRPDQIDQARQRDNSRVANQSKDWSDWLSTMFANPSNEKNNDALQPTTNNSDIPAVAKYRLPALRGDILTADGKPLATMTQSQDLVLSWPPPEVAPDEESALAWMRSRLALARDWLKQDFDITDTDLRSLHRFQRFHPLVVAQDLTADQVTAFAKTSLSTKGFSLQGVPRRIYPHGTSVAHAVGYLQRKQGRNKKQYQAADVIYDDYQGASGLEELFDKDLRGQEGELTIETSPSGFTQKALVTKEATTGATVRLTIDSRVQKAAEAALQNVREGAVVVMNIHNGDVVAMASRPTFNPNDFIPFLAPDKWQSLIQDPNRPLLDRVYRQQNPPGSTFKVITTLAAMRAGVFDPNRTVPCPGYYEVGNMRYELPQERSSPVSFRRAIARSFNTYFFDLGLHAGVPSLLATAHDFGIGQSTGFILPGELSGLMPDDSFVRTTHNRAMGPGDLANASIGQGDVLATPLQMASMISAVANGGTLFRPRLVQQVEGPPGQPAKNYPTEIIRKISLTPEERSILTSGLIAVTEEGTAQAARISGIQVASKTGTAQVGSKNRPRQIAWLVGFLPANKPQYAFTVMIEGGWNDDLHGGEDAAPVAGKLFGTIFSQPQAILTQATRPVSE